MPLKPIWPSGKWTDKLDPQEVRDALEDATADAHGEYEQDIGLLAMIQQQVAFPFPAVVLGEEIEVAGMLWPEGDELGLDLVCVRGGQRYRVEARSVELLPPLPAGHLYIAAYLDWKSGLG